MTDTRARRKPPTLRTTAERAADYVLEDQVGFLLRCAHQRATEIFNAVMAEFSVTPTQFAALAKLDDLRSVSQNQLGRLTAMDPATISGVIGRLTTRGYVQAVARPQGCAPRHAGLTPAGKAAITAMKAVAAEVSRSTLEPLDAARGGGAGRARSPRSGEAMFAPPVIQQLTGDRLHLSHGPIDVVLKAWGTPEALRAAYDAAGRALPDASCPSCATSWPCCAGRSRSSRRSTARWRGAWLRPAARSPTCSSRRWRRWPARWPTSCSRT